MDRKAWDKFIDEKNPLLVSCYKSMSHALDHFTRRTEEDERRFCITELDQAIELFFKGILLRKGKEPYEMRFPKVLAGIRPLLDITEADETLVSALHKERNSCQHEGKIPGSVETEHLVHSTLRLFLDKAHRFLGITPDQMCERIPNLRFMGVREATTRELPEKPEILKYLENASTELLVMGDHDMALSQISLALQGFIETLYEFEEGPPLSGYSMEPPHERVSSFDPQELVRREVESMLPTLEVEFKSMKLVMGRMPFKTEAHVQWVPKTAYAIKELFYLEEENILDADVSKRSLKLLRIYLLHSLKDTFPRKTQRSLEQYFKKVLTFRYLIDELVFARNCIVSNEPTGRILDRYFDDRDKALFGIFENE